MTETATSALWKNFLGPSPIWYKKTIVAFLLLNPLFLFVLGPFVTGWLLILEFIFTLALASTLFVFLIGLITGSIYSPENAMRFMFRELEFIPGYFIATFGYLTLVMFFALLIKRAGLAIGVVIIYPAMEYAFTGIMSGISALRDDAFEAILPIGDYLPMHAFNAIIEIPFPRYVFIKFRITLTPYKLPLSLVISVSLPC